MSFFENLRYILAIALTFLGLLVGLIGLFSLVRGRFPFFNLQGRKWGFFGLMVGFIIAVIGAFLAPSQKVEITAAPAGATIELDGKKYRGKTGEISLLPSTYTVKVSAPNYKPETRQIQIPGPRTYSFTLQKAPAVAAVKKPQPSQAKAQAPATPVTSSQPPKQTGVVSEQPTSTPPVTRTESLTPIDSSQYDFSTPKGIVAEFVAYWQAKNWEEMVRLTPPSWRNSVDDPVEHISAIYGDTKVLKGARIVDFRENEAGTGTVVVQVQYQSLVDRRLVTTYFKFPVLRETNAGERSFSVIDSLYVYPVVTDSDEL